MPRYGKASMPTRMDVEIRSAFRAGTVLVEPLKSTPDVPNLASVQQFADRSGFRHEAEVVASIFQRSAVTYESLLKRRSQYGLSRSQLHIGPVPGDIWISRFRRFFSPRAFPALPEHIRTDTDFTLDDLSNGRFDVVPEFAR